MKRSMTAATMTWCCLAVGTALGDGTPQHSQRGPAGIAVEEPLLKARAKLLEQGWNPTRRHVTDNYEYSGAELELTARKVFEVDSCSSDSSRCILFYAKKASCLRIDTIGEKLRDMTVTRWVEECPDAHPKPNHE
jgi:hypothetical protein